MINDLTDIPAHGKVAIVNPDGSTAGDPWMQYVIAEIYDVYGVRVLPKPKQLRKFGRTANADNGVKTTVGQFQGTVVNETFATTNSVDKIVSSSASDTGQVNIEGHTIDGSGNLTFVTQTATLNGQTPVTLSTAMARCSRIYVKEQTFASPAVDLVGQVVVYDSAAGGSVTAGVPATAAAVKALIAAGSNQTEKWATTFSSVDYFVMTKVEASVQKGNSSTVAVDIDIEVRRLGGVWRPLGLEISLRAGSESAYTEMLMPYAIIPANSDIRMVATSNTNDTTVSGRMSGQLLLVTG